jgi:hypothetical protein
VLYTAQKVDGEFTVTWEEGHGYSKGRVNYNVSVVAGYINSKLGRFSQSLSAVCCQVKSSKMSSVPEPVVTISEQPST